MMINTTPDSVLSTLNLTAIVCAILSLIETIFVAVFGTKKVFEIRAEIRMLREETKTMYYDVLKVSARLQNIPIPVPIQPPQPIIILKPKDLESEPPPTPKSR